MYVCMSTCYSALSRFLLGGAPDYRADTESEFHAEAHEQLRVMDLPRVPTRRLEVDSNPQPSGCKALNIPLHHRAPQKVIFCLGGFHLLMSFLGGISIIMTGSWLPEFCETVYEGSRLEEANALHQV